MKPLKQMVITVIDPGSVQRIHKGTTKVDVYGERPDAYFVKFPGKAYPVQLSKDGVIGLDGQWTSTLLEQ